MKLVTFSRGDTPRAGVLDESGDRIIDLRHPALQGAMQGVNPRVHDMLLAGLPRLLEGIERCIIPGEASVALSQVRLHAPLQRPPRIIGVAHNYRDAVAERGLPPPDQPVVFEKSAETVIGPGDAILLPDGIGGVTYEAELAVVMGRPAYQVSERNALAHVAGYAVFNDISASEVIRRDGHFGRGKNFPTFGPFGPWLVSADEVPDPQDLGVYLKSGERILQNGTTADMIFGVAALIARLSSHGVLQAGDVIATGTPAGVAAMKRPPAWLQPGHTLHAEVEGLGTLRNPVQQDTQR